MKKAASRIEHAIKCGLKANAETDDDDI